MSSITTHVLDTSLGCPAAGVPVTLFRIDESENAAQAGRGVTDADGRVMNLMASETVPAGAYRLEFDVAAYFSLSDRKTFYRRVDIDFIVDADQHYHVPLLLSPFGYTTYRGS